MTSSFIPSDGSFEDNSLQKDLPHNEAQQTKEYFVKNFDTLRSIAVAFNTTTSAIKKLNRLSSSTIFSGQTLLIPKVDMESDEGDVASKDLSPLKIPLNGKDEFDFLAPLSASPTTPKSVLQKPFQDLIVVSSPEQRANEPADDIVTNEIPSSNSIDMKRDSVSSETTSGGQAKSYQVDQFREWIESSKRKRVFSSESCQSEPLEENFVKMTVDYMTGVDEVVRGVLLITPTSAMFDPDPNCAPVLEHGCEKFGIMCDLINIISIAVYNSLDNQQYSSISSPSPVIINKEDIPDVSGGNSCDLESSLDLADDANDVCADKQASSQSDGSKLMFEFPFLHSIVKTVEDYLPGNAHHAEGRIRSKNASESEKRFFYLCVKSEEPMMRTFSAVTMNDNNPASSEGSDDIRECWFRFPEERSDQLLAFFLQWSPDSYALDFAEQNGFVDADSIVEKKKTTAVVKKEEEARSRSSTNSSLVFIEDYFADKEVKKEWEEILKEKLPCQPLTSTACIPVCKLLSAKEAGRRAKLNANELANDDTSLMPELLHKSNLMKDQTVLELCRHIPARCVGCPWRLLYSTFEHGTSLRTLYRKMNQRLDDTPAVVVVQDSENYIFGVLCSSRPHISEHFYGTGESFLFSVDPKFEVYPWSGENSFFIKGDADALMFGGGDGTAGLWLDGDLSHGRSRPCYTYSNPMLSSTEDFFIHAVEVWGFDDS